MYHDVYGLNFLLCCLILSVLMLFVARFYVFFICLFFSPFFFLLSPDAAYGDSCVYEPMFFLFFFLVMPAVLSKYAKPDISSEFVQYVLGYAGCQTWKTFGRRTTRRDLRHLNSEVEVLRTELKTLKEGISESKSATVLVIVVGCYQRV